MDEGRGSPTWTGRTGGRKGGMGVEDGGRSDEINETKQPKLEMKLKGKMRAFHVRIARM